MQKVQPLILGLTRIDVRHSAKGLFINAEFPKPEANYPESRSHGDITQFSEAAEQDY